MRPPKKRVSRLPSRYQAFADGELTVEDLDMDELIRGQLKDKNGNFTGREPSAIPRAFHKAVVRELINRVEGRLRGDLEDMFDVLGSIARNPRAPAVARNQAAFYIIERIAGKVPDKQVVETFERKWEQGITDLIVDIDPNPEVPSQGPRQSRPAARVRHQDEEEEEE